MIVAGDALSKKGRLKKGQVEVVQTDRRKTREGSRYRSHSSASVRRTEKGYPAAAVGGNVNDSGEGKGCVEVEVAGNARRWHGRKRD